MTITQLRYNQKDKNRITVFIDGKYYCALDQQFVLDGGLFVGKEVTEEQMSSLKTQDRRSYYLKRLGRFLAMRPRSQAEIERKLQTILTADELTEDEKQEVVAEIMPAVIKMGVNDHDFAEWYVSQRLAQGKYGSQRVMAELLAKGVSRAEASEAVKTLKHEEEELVPELLERKFGVRSLTQISDFKERSKAYRYLKSRGF